MIIFRDRRALFAPFYKPTGISVEFDYRVDAIKILPQ